MTNAMFDGEIHDLEAALRHAVLTSDVVALDRLLDERFCLVRPDGTLVSKEEDLKSHLSGAQRITRFDIDELHVEIHGPAAVTFFRSRVEGVLRGRPVQGMFRYTRTWIRRGPQWSLVSSHAALLSSP